MDEGSVVRFSAESPVSLPTWEGYEQVGITPIRRALVAVFALNHPRRLRVHQVEERFDLFPPLEH